MLSLAALTAALSDRSSAIPDELQQLHLLLTQIIYADEGAKSWWPDQQSASPELPLAASADKKAGEKKGWWSPDAKAPVKCNLQAILASEEPTASVRRWVTVLESVAPMRTNTGAPIKAAVDLASSVTRDTEVKRFLARSLKHFKGNAAGTAKHAALWLAAQALTLTRTSP